MPLLLQDARGLGPQPLDQESAGVDQDLPQIRVVVGPAVEDQQASLRGDGDANLIRNLEAGAADERLLGHEYLDVFLELAPKVARKAAHVGHAPIEDLAPGRGERSRAQLPSPPRDEERLRHHPGHEQEGEAGDEEEGHWRQMRPGRGYCNRC